MNKPFLLIGLTLFFLLTNACANYKRHFVSESNTEGQLQLRTSTTTISHSVYLIGNVGSNSKPDEPTLQTLQTHLMQADSSSTLLLLGDQLGKRGMPPHTQSEKRNAAEHILDVQLNLLKGFKGRPIFIPGNADWNFYGLKGLRRQEQYIEETLNAQIAEEDDWQNYFLPDDGCPGPEVIEINKNLVLIILDTQWWLTDWDEQPNVNEGCDIKSREAFELAVLAEIKDHKNKNIIFTTHHDFQSVGPHGGKFTVKDHLFPFTAANEKAWLPIPVVGSMYLFLRKAGILQQDISNRHYEELRDVVLDPAEANGEFIFVSAGDHSLQYLQDDGQHIIASGSGGNKVTATAKDAKALFSSAENGFSKIDIYKDGSAWVSFWVPEKNSAQGKMIYRHQMKQPLPAKENQIKSETDFSEYNNKSDSVFTSPSTRKIEPLGNFATYMFGERRRAIYLQEYNFPCLDLSTFKGGLKVIKKGGGKQTSSLRLQSKEGHEYVMRALTKDVKRGVPYPFNQLPYVNFLFSETFLGSHPFAPITLGILSDSANLYHANPGLYYVPKQPALDGYNDEFGGEVYLIEEHASGEWPEADFYGNGEKFVNTTKLYQKREKNYKHRVDQRWVVRARLFDMLIGDIDRHGDQWRWVRTETEDGSYLYRPIPRDRDNAFSHYDGFIYKLLWPYHPIIRQLNEYGENLGNPKWSYYNARHFDHNFMNEMTLDDWLSEAEFLKKQISEEVVDQAMALFPPKVAELSASQIRKTLLHRRDHLTEIATEFYKQLSKKAIVQGSDKKELFEVIRRDDEHTEINVYNSNKEGDKQERVYHRVFKTSETREVYIYGMADDDIFRINGKANKGIRIHIVGGPGDDDFSDESKVAGLSKHTIIYDTPKGNTLKLGSEAKDKTSNDALNNIYEALGPQFNEGNLIGAPLAGFNAGDGATVGFFLLYKVYRFNKFPMAQKHHLKANYASFTKGVHLQYGSILYENIRKWDLVINGEYRSDRYSFNFFGLGNESPAKNNEIAPYRVLQTKTYIDIGWQHRFAKETSVFSIRPLLQYTAITDTGDRYIDDPNNGLTAKDFESRWYGGLASGLQIANTDNDIHPRDGYRFNNDFTWQKNLTGSERHFQTFETDFTLYKSFLKRRLLVLATRVGAAWAWGDYDFFFAPTIGEDENIRGYYGQRFRGQTAFFHTTDLRMAVGKVSNSILPFSIGVTGSFDHGRIFQSGEDSNQWHRSVGGGIWLVPLNVVVISLNVNYSLDGYGRRFKVEIGHSF